MGDSISTYFIGITGNSQSLEDTFRTYRNRISSVAKNITEYHVFQALFIILPSNVQSYIFHRSQLISIFFVLLQLFFTETTGVCTSCIHFIPFFLSQIHYSERSIKTATERNYYFFLFFFHNNMCFFYYFFFKSCLPRVKTDRKASQYKYRTYGFLPSIYHD